MKRYLVFIPGMILSTLLLMGSILGIRAVFADTTSDNITSDNTVASFIGLLPDIQRIYREALTTPLNQVKEVIYDKDIGEFYDELLRRTGLDTP